MSRTALQVMEDHSAKMATQDPDVILQDYAQDAVVLTNLSCQPLVGHQAIRTFIQRLLSDGVLQRMEGAPTEMLYLEGREGKATQVFRKTGTPIFGSETYVVENDLIVFESAYITLD